MTSQISLKKTDPGSFIGEILYEDQVTNELTFRTAVIDVERIPPWHKGQFQVTVIKILKD